MTTKNPGEKEEDLLPRGFSRETTIKRDARGVWSQDGQALSHEKLTRSFDRWLERRPSGRYCLRNSIHWVYVHIEGPALWVRSLRLEPSGAVAFELSDDTSLITTTPIIARDCRDHLFLQVQARNLWALFDNHSVTQLAEFLQSDGDEVYASMGQVRVPIGELRADDTPWQQPSA